MGFTGVTQVLVVTDDHITIDDLFEGAKAQVVDTKLGNYKTEATAVDTERRWSMMRRKKRKNWAQDKCIWITNRLVRPRMISRFSKGLSEFKLSGQSWIQRYPEETHVVNFEPLPCVFTVPKCSFAFSSLTSNFFNCFKHIELWRLHLWSFGV